MIMRRPTESPRGKKTDGSPKEETIGEPPRWKSFPVHEALPHALVQEHRRGNFADGCSIVDLCNSDNFSPTKPTMGDIIRLERGEGSDDGFVWSLPFGVPETI